MPYGADLGRGTEMIVDAPAIVGNVPESHADFKWTIEHRNAHLMPRNRNATTAMANFLQQWRLPQFVSPGRHGIHTPG